MSRCVNFLLCYVHSGWWFDGEVATVILNPLDAIVARETAADSLRDAQRLYPNSGICCANYFDLHYLFPFLVQPLNTLGKSK